MTSNRQNIIICGFMATGKSSVGRTLASMIGFDFLDLDDLIAAEAGKSIPEIFASQGEQAFRALESGMVERVAGRNRCVIATGGGTIVNQMNYERLKQSGTIIVLTADPETILARVGSGDDRPMLRGGDKLERIRVLMEQRAPAYAKADFFIDTSDRTIDQVAKQILDCLGK